jgi:hypothetical protein
VTLNLESAFSIMYILPSSVTYQDRKMTDTELDAGELDQLSLSSAHAAEGAAAVTSTPRPPRDWLVALVVPSPAAFARYPQICTTRDCVAKDPTVTAADWAKHSTTRIGEDGLLACTSPTTVAASVGSRHSVASDNGSKRGSLKVKDMAMLENAADRIPELHVTTRQDGRAFYMRGVLYLPITGGYVIEAPRVSPTLADAADSAITTSRSQKESAARASAVARIHVLQHPVVDDLYALGAVATSDFGDAPILVCEQPGTHTKADGTVCVAYHVAVESKFIQEVEGTVGSAFDTRIRKVSGPMLRFYECAVMKCTWFLLLGLGDQQSECTI